MRPDRRPAPGGRVSTFHLILVAITINAYFWSFGMVAEGTETSDQVRWQASWIWQSSTPWLRLNPSNQSLEFPDVQPGEKNVHLYFRKTFALTDQAQAAPAYVSADSVYRLYVNAQLVGRGPARSYPSEKYYDVYDLTGYLRPGKNVIAAVVHFYGEDTAWHVSARAGVIGFDPGTPSEPAVGHVRVPSTPLMGNAVPGKGGFLFQCDIRTRTGQELTVITDTSWKIQQAKAWKQAVPRANFSLGFVEIYDARQEPAGWKEVDFDDSQWGTALPYWSWSKPVPPTEPFTASASARGP